MHISTGRDFGGNLRFSGAVSTVKCFENNPLVRKVLDGKRTGGGHGCGRQDCVCTQHVCMSSHNTQALEQPGNGGVLVVDGGASMRCALLGDNIAEMAYKNGWSVRAECV